MGAAAGVAVAAGAGFELVRLVARATGCPVVGHSGTEASCGTPQWGHRMKRFCIG